VSKPYCRESHYGRVVVAALGRGDARLAYAILGLTTIRSKVIAPLMNAMAAGVAGEQEGKQSVNLNDAFEKVNVVERLVNYG
jgi:hypothetical protein